MKFFDHALYSCQNSTFHYNKMKLQDSNQDIEAYTNVCKTLVPRARFDDSSSLLKHDTMSNGK
jgi:hypothetical protein